MVINSGHAENKQLCILSYNSRGFGKIKQEYCKQLVSEYIVGDKLPILCNQENFILKGNSYKINQVLPGFHLFIKPAVKKNMDKGRAKNGMFIAVPDEVKNQVQDVSPAFWRIQAVKIKSSSSEILLSIRTFPPIREK